MILQRKAPVFYRDSEGSGRFPDGEDPWERDDGLARQFKIALRYQQMSPSSTANPYGLRDRTQDILKRVNEAGRVLILLAPTLRPIAGKLLTLKGSDRENAIIVAHIFQNLELATEP